MKSMQGFTYEIDDLEEAVDELKEQIDETQLLENSAAIIFLKLIFFPVWIG